MDGDRHLKRFVESHLSVMRSAGIQVELEEDHRGVIPGEQGKHTGEDVVSSQVPSAQHRASMSQTPAVEQACAKSDHGPTVMEDWATSAWASNAAVSYEDAGSVHEFDVVRLGLILDRCKWGNGRKVARPHPDTQNMGAALWNSLIDWGLNDVRRMAISHSTANSGGVNDDIDAVVLGSTCRTPMSAPKKPKGKTKTLAQANRQTLSAPCDALNDALVICAGEIQKVPSTQEAEAAARPHPQFH